MSDTTHILIEATPTTPQDLQAIRSALQEPGLDAASAAAWHTFLAQTAANGYFDLLELDSLVGETLVRHSPQPSIVALILEVLRLATTIRERIPPGQWLALAQTESLAFLQARRHNEDSRRALWEFAFSALSHQIRHLYDAPDLEHLAGVFRAYPFVIEDEHMVPSLLSPLMDAWADHPELLAGLMEAYGHFPAIARKYARLTAN